PVTPLTSTNGSLSLLSTDRSCSSPMTEFMASFRGTIPPFARPRAMPSEQTPARCPKSGTTTPPRARSSTVCSPTRRPIPAAYAPSFTGGVNVGSGDVNGDGVADILVGAGPTGGPHVQAFDGRTLAKLRSFFAFDPNFTGGITVSATDLDGDGFDDVLAAKAT